MNKHVILIVDDEPQIRKLLEINLENNGYKVLQAETAKEGIILAASHSPDLILLDIGLPDRSGHQVLQDLRTWYAKSIIIVSVQTRETDIVQALDNGASDYLTKPFRMGELMARIRLHIKRNSGSENMQTQKTGDLEIDYLARLVTKNTLPVKLTTTEYNLLCLFLKNEGCVLTHQYILKEIRGVGFQQETQYLRVFINTLRKKIEDDSNHPKHILTESGIGYRFV